ncbi:uncharacterized protein METZ01_LOCUS52381, partial [marine metagenome]
VILGLFVSLAASPSPVIPAKAGTHCAPLLAKESVLGEFFEPPYGHKPC